MTGATCKQVSHMVGPDLTACIMQVSAQAFGNATLVAGKAVNPHQGQESIQNELGSISRQIVACRTHLDQYRTRCVAREPARAF